MLFNIIDAIRKNLVSTIALLIRKPGRTKNAKLFSTGKKPSKKEHEHQEYLSKNEIAKYTEKFANQSEQFCHFLHDHPEYVSTKLLKESGLDKPLLVIDDTLFFQEKHYIIFARKNHSHPEFVVKKPIGKSYSINKTADLKHSYAKNEHEHDDKMKYNQKVEMVFNNNEYSLVNHVHPNKDLPKVYKTKKTGITETNNIKCAIIKSNFSGKAVENKLVSFRLPLIDSIKFLPDDMIATQLVVKVPSTFFTYFKDAIVDFHDSFKNATGDFSSLYEYKYYMRPVQENTIMQILKFFITFGSYAPIAPAERITIYKKHFSRFANSIELETTSEIPNKINIVSWASQVPSIESFREEIEKINLAMNFSERLIRQLEEIPPNEDFNYVLSSLFNVGSVLVLKQGTKNVLKINHGGWPFNIAFFGGV